MFQGFSDCRKHLSKYHKRIDAEIMSAMHSGLETMFQESEFLRACDELDNPDVEGWELFTDSNGVKIYRLYNKVCLCIIIDTLKS